MLLRSLRAPTTHTHWEDAAALDEGRSVGACWRIGRDLDRDDVRRELDAWLAGDDPRRARAAARVLAWSDEPSDAALFAALSALLDHPSPDVALEAALAFHLRARRKHPLGPALAAVATAQRRREIQDQCAFALGASTKQRLPEPELEAALPAVIATLDVRWESTALLARAFDEGVFHPTREDFDGPVGEIGRDRERGRLAARLWRHAVDEGLVELDELVTRLLREARSKKADEARHAVSKLTHLRAAGFELSPFVHVLDALLGHPKSTVTVAAHDLLQSRASRPEAALFSVAEKEGATHVAKGRPTAVSPTTRRSVADLVTAVAALPKGRSLKDQAARQNGEVGLSTALGLAWLDPSTREDAESAIHTLAGSKDTAGIAGRAFATAWLDHEGPKLARFLEETTAPVTEGALLGISHWSDADRTREIDVVLLDTLRALHLAKSDRLRRAAWFCRFSGAAVLREALLRSGEVSVLALVAWGEERGAKLSVRALNAQLTQCPTSLDVCLPAIAYALHGEPRHELLMTPSGLLDRGEVPLELAQALVPLVAGVLLDRDFAGPIVDRRACEVLAKLFERGADSRGVLPLLGPRLDELEAVVALCAGLRSSARLTRGLEEGALHTLGKPLQLASHPARALEELERRFLLASALGTEAA